MTQDLKDLCLIKKSSLNRLARAYNYEYGVDDDDAMQALAQDLSGMRLVAPPPQTDDELFKSPWYEFAKEAYYDMGNITYFATIAELKCQPSTSTKAL